MATVKFSKPSSATPTAAPVTPAAAPASAAQPATLVVETPVQEAPAQGAGAATCVVESSQLPAPIQSSSPTFFEDENEGFDPRDLVLARLSIVQKTGERSELHPHGSILLGDLRLVDGPKNSAVGSESDPVRILVIGFRPTQYVEKVEFGLRGNTFNSPEEVVRAGGTIDYKEAQAKKIAWYQPSTTAMIVVEQVPGTAEQCFPLEIEGKRYALALATWRASAYTGAAKPIKSAKQIGHLRGGYRTGWWQFRSKVAKSPQGSATYYVPSVRPAEASTPEFQAGLSALLGF